MGMSHWKTSSQPLWDISSTRKVACVADALDKLRFNFHLMLPGKIQDISMAGAQNQATLSSKPSQSKTRNYPELQFKHSLPHGPSGVLTTNFSSAIPHHSSQAKVRLCPFTRHGKGGGLTEHFVRDAPSKAHLCLVWSIPRPPYFLSGEDSRKHRVQTARTKKTSPAPTA